MKKILLFYFFGMGLHHAQTINYKGCYNLFNNQDYTFNKTGTDTYGKGIYITTPVDGAQACGGLGTCEFKIQWNNTNTRWEFLADSGNGDFVNPYLIYYNSTGNPNATNPPNNQTGTWKENVAITQGECGGDMTNTNSTFTGDVQSSTLAVSDLKNQKLKIYPNPVKDLLNIISNEQIATIKIFDLSGRLLQSEKAAAQLNVSHLAKGMYLLKIETKDAKNYELKFIKN